MARVAEFEWWDIHDASWRRARWLFVWAAVVVALYVAGLASIVILSGWAIVSGSARDIEARLDDVGAVELIVAAGVVLAVSAVAIMIVAWRGLPGRVHRFARSRAPRGQEAEQAQRIVDAFALSYGMLGPVVWVIDDPVPNALAFGRPADGNICVTTGALALPPDELESLCMFHVAALASRAFAFATSAADLVLLGEWCTRLLWGTAAFVILAMAFGVPAEAAGIYVVGVLALVLVTRPILVFTDRSLVALLDDGSELVDLEMVRHSNEPAPLARLLLHLLEDDGCVKSRWEIAHLWFERDVVEFVDNTSRFMQLVGELSPAEIGVPAFVGRCAERSRRGLFRRAETAVNLTSGDTALRTRLARAEASISATR